MSAALTAVLLLLSLGAWTLLRSIYRTLPLRQQTRLGLKEHLFKRFPLLASLSAPHPDFIASETAKHDSRRAEASTTQLSIDTAAQKKYGESLSALRTKVSYEPTASIIIPAFGQIVYTLQCLKSLTDVPTSVPFEIVVVDDCSPDNTREVIGNISGVRLLENEENKGFIRSCNAAAAIARGEFLVFLNNDTEVTDGWLDELITTFHNVPDAGLVGSKLIYPDGRLQEAGAIIWRDGSAWNFGRSGDVSHPEFNYLREVDYCSGASLAVRRSLFIECGGFDENYVPAYCEDSDLAFKVRRAGQRVYYQPLSTVRHYEGITSGTDLTSGVKAYQVQNTAKLFERWKSDISLLEAPGENVDRAKDRGILGRMLVVDHCTPTPDKDAGSVAMLNLMRSLQAHGYQVTFAPEDNFLHMPKYTPALQRAGIEVLYAPAYTSLKDHLEEDGGRYDGVLLHRPLVGKRHLDDVERYCPRARLLYLAADLHFLRMQREAEVTGDPSTLTRAEAMQREEFSIMKRCHTVLVHSTYEAELLAREFELTNVHVFKWPIEIPGTRAGFHDRKDLCFIGSYGHPPNVDAVEYFVHEILPLVKRQLSHVRFYIVGSSPPDRFREFSDEAVVVAGFVEELAPFLDGIRVAVAPLRYGAGTKGKITTTLAAGLPGVCTSVAAEGMELADGKEILIADTPADFANSIVRLYRSQELWSAMSQSGIAFAQRSYGFGQALPVVKEILLHAGLGANDQAISRLRSVSRVVSGDRNEQNGTPGLPAEVVALRSFSDYQERQSASVSLRRARENTEKFFVRLNQGSFDVPGFCVVCEQFRSFRVDHRFACATDETGRPLPNWRESLLCQQCLMNNRVRAAVDLFRNYLEPQTESRIYTTEQVTPFFGWLKTAYPSAIGSEFLGKDRDAGQLHEGLRHEDVTALSFRDSSLDFILSFDVLEHVPDYQSGIAEFMRCLRKGGSLLLSVPFASDGYDTIVRAKLKEDGSIEHILEPEYHGNPTQPEKSLCFYHFGWDLLDTLRTAGASDVKVLGYYSFERANLGPEQLFFVARR